MQQRRLSYISEFNCKIIHLPGAENVDALSWPVSPSSAPNPDSNPSSISQGPVKASSTPNPETNPSYSPPQPASVGSQVPEVSVVSEVTEQMVSSPPSPSPAGSLPQPPPSVPGISYQEMSILQQSCPKVQDLRLSSALTVVSVPFSGSVLWCDSSTGILRPLVPETMRRLVFNTIHSVSHPEKKLLED